MCDDALDLLSQMVLHFLCVSITGPMRQCRSDVLGHHYRTLAMTCYWCILNKNEAIKSFIAICAGELYFCLGFRDAHKLSGCSVRLRHAPCRTSETVTPPCKAGRSKARPTVFSIVFGRYAAYRRMRFSEDRWLCHLSGCVLKRSPGIPAGQRRGRSSWGAPETGRALKQCINEQIRT